MENKNIAYLAYIYEKDIEEVMKKISKKRTFYMSDHEFLDLFKETVRNEDIRVNKNFTCMESKSESIEEIVNTKVIEEDIYCEELKELLNEKNKNSEKLKSYSNKILMDNYLINISENGMSTVDLYKKIIPISLRQQNPVEYWNETVLGLWGLGRVVGRGGKKGRIIMGLDSLRCNVLPTGKFLLKYYKEIAAMVRGLFFDKKEEFKKVKKESTKFIEELSFIIDQYLPDDFKNFLRGKKQVIPRRRRIKMLEIYLEINKNELFKILD